MRWPAFACDAFATVHVQAGATREIAQFLDAKAEIAVIERRHRGTVCMTAERCRQQPPAGTQHARGFGNDLARLLAVGECVHQHNKIETPRAGVQRVHVAELHGDVAEGFEARARGRDDALAGIHAQDRLGMRRQQFCEHAIAGGDVQHIAAIDQAGASQVRPGE